MSKITKKSISNPNQYKTPETFTHEELLAAIRHSIIAEFDAINLYEALKAATDNEAFREVMDHLIEEEKEHASELELLLNDMDEVQKQKDEEALKELHVHGFIKEGVQLIKLLAKKKDKKENKKKVRPFMRNYDYAKSSIENIAKEEQALQKQIVIVVDDTDFENLLQQQNKNSEEDILNKIEEYNKKLRYDRYLPQYGEVTKNLVQLADSLDKKKLFKLADEIDRVANEIVFGENPIETILLGYQKIHQIAQLKEFEQDVKVDKNILAKQISEMIEQDLPAEEIREAFENGISGLPEEDIKDIKLMIQKDYNWDYDQIIKESERTEIKQFVRGVNKVAKLRKNDERCCEGCPFGLPIPQACKYAGDCVLFMTPNCEIDECKRENREIYNEDRLGQPCIYADNILEKSVNCNYGTTTEGKHVPKLFRSSPIYPKLFNSFNSVALDRQYHLYHDFAFQSIYG